MRSKILIVVLALAICFTGAVGGSAGGTVSEVRLVAPFDRVRMQGAGTLKISQGDSLELQLEGEKEDLAKVRTYVENGELIIKKETAGWFDNREIHARIKMVRVRSLSASGSVKIIGPGVIKSSDLSLSGSGSIKMDLNLKTEKLHTSLSGSAKAVLKGLAADHVFKASGSSKLMAFELNTNKTMLKISGSGKAEIKAAREVDISISGSAKVYLKGAARVRKMATAGSGELLRVD